MRTEIFNDYDYIDEKDFIEAYCAAYDMEPSDGIPVSDLLNFMQEERDAALDSAIAAVDGALESADGGAMLMVRGDAQRWNGISSGYGRFYESFRELMSDGGYDGVFKDCRDFEISEIDGTLHIEGVHHDGRVRLDVRAVGADAVGRFNEYEDGHSEAETARYLDRMWEAAHDLQAFPSCAPGTGLDLETEAWDARAASRALAEERPGGGPPTPCAAAAKEDWRIELTPHMERRADGKAEMRHRIDVYRDDVHVADVDGLEPWQGHKMHGILCRSVRETGDLPPGIVAAAKSPEHGTLRDALTAACDDALYHIRLAEQLIGDLDGGAIDEDEYYRQMDKLLHWRDNDAALSAGLRDFVAEEVDRYFDKSGGYASKEFMKDARTAEAKFSPSCVMGTALDCASGRGAPPTPALACGLDLESEIRDARAASRAIGEGPSGGPGTPPQW